MFKLRNGKVYQGTGNDKEDLRVLLTKYMTKFGGRKPTSAELMKLGKNEEMPLDINIYSTHFGGLDEAIKQAGFWIPKNNPIYMEREEFTKKAAEITLKHHAVHFDVSMLNELDISDELLEKYYGNVFGLDREIQPTIRAAEVSRKKQLAIAYQAKLNAEKKAAEKEAKEVEGQMKEKNKESDRPLTNSNHLTSTLNMPTIEPKPEVKPEPEPVVEEPKNEEPEAEVKVEPEEAVAEYSEASTDDDEYYLLDEDSESVYEAEQPTTEEPEPEVETPEPEPEPKPKPEAPAKTSKKKKEKKFEKAKNVEVSDEELDKIAALMEEGKSLKNYYSLCQYEGYVVLQDRLTRIGILLREKKNLAEVLPSWGTLRKTFGPSCKYDEVFGLPFKNFRHTLNRQKTQEAQLTSADLERFERGKQNLRGFLESNWENIPTRKKKAPEYREKVEYKEKLEYKEETKVEVKEEEKDMDNSNNFPNNSTVEERALPVETESLTTKAKISTISKGNGVMQIMIEREPIVITLPEGVHINMKVTLPKEVIDVEV